MEESFVYAGGGISGLTYEECVGWRMWRVKCHLTSTFFRRCAGKNI